MYVNSKRENAVCTLFGMSKKKVTVMAQSKFFWGHLQSNRHDLDDECDYYHSIWHSKLFGKNATLLFIITDLTEKFFKEKKVFFFQSFGWEQNKSKKTSFQKSANSKKETFLGQ